MGLISIQQLPEVRFDVENEEHLLAYAMVMFGDRQHPTLRFILELPFGDVPRMMESKISEKYCRDILGDRFPKGKENDEPSSSDNGSNAAIIYQHRPRKAANG